MAEMTQHQQAIEALRNQARNLASLSPDTLARRELGQANFESLMEEFKSLQTFATRIANCSWAGVAAGILAEITSRCTGLMIPIQAIQSFTVMRSGVDLPGERNRCINQFQTQWNSFYGYIAPHLVYAESMDAKTDKSRETLASILADAETSKIQFINEITSLREEMVKDRERLRISADEVSTRSREKMEDALNDQEKKLRAAQAQIQKNLEQMGKQQEAVLNADRERISKRVAEIESNTTAQLEQAMLKQESELKVQLERINAVVTQVEENAKGKAVGLQSHEFNDLAKGYQEMSGLWFVLALWAGYGLYWYIEGLQVPTNIKDPVILAEHLIPRLIAVTLLSTALIFCIRNFSAQMHNLVVNRHRQKALRTFEVFAGATSDPATKNAVLVQATQAIFAPQPSGYLKTDQEVPQMNQVTEIVRGVTGKENG